MKTRAKIIFVGVIIALSIVVFSLIDAEYVSIYRVSTGSMSPAFEVGDIVLLDKKIAFDDLRVGDVIVFERPEGEYRIIISRIIDIDYTENQKTITTKGDANPASIPGTNFPIIKDNLIGKVIEK
ncbi:signal peptidase I [Nitrosarchaeum sp. AC2]|uniref:signal peptidase I n=1 Tax=Nitrosarchaeum sp. AC2 TaxID=2259673 RepID=UPI0015C98B12|nr:signal peptidase I [Nitrosarchaeum sp. AC2]QLH10819.1 signal peptidase I [Nitrosarchaeum sp. AC2]